VIFNTESCPATVPKNFRAAVLSRLSQPLKTVTVVTPEYLTAGQLLVELHYSGACASQIHEIDGRKGEDPYLPHMLGHEGVGTVRWVGPGVSQHNVGDVVIAHWRKSLGMCLRENRFNCLADVFLCVEAGNNHGDMGFKRARFVSFHFR